MQTHPTAALLRALLVASTVGLASPGPKRLVDNRYGLINLAVPSSLQRIGSSGLDYFGARYYASRTERFVGLDPAF